MNVQPFTFSALTTPIAVTTTASTAVQLPNQGSVLRVVNELTVTIYVAIGLAGVVATLPNATQTLTSVPIAAGEDYIGTIPSDQKYYISIISRTSSGNAYVQVGDGL